MAVRILPGTFFTTLDQASEDFQAMAVGVVTEFVGETEVGDCTIGESILFQR